MRGLGYLLLGAALAEAILLRVAIRVGPFFPADPAVDMIFAAMQTAGLAALNTMLILGVGLLGWECIESVRGGQLPRAMSTGLAVAAVAAGLALPSGPGLLASCFLFLAALLTSISFRDLRACDQWVPGIAPGHRERNGHVERSEQSVTSGTEHRSLRQAQGRLFAGAFNNIRHGRGRGHALTLTLSQRERGQDKSLPTSGGRPAALQAQDDNVRLSVARRRRMTTQDDNGLSGRVSRILPLLSYASLGAYYALQSAGVLGIGTVDSVGLFWLGEALAVAAAIALPWAYRPPWRPRMAVLAAGAAGAFLALGWGRFWLLGTMVMWNWGFSLWLPLPLYAIALGTFLYTVLALLGSRPSATLVPVGLLLVGLGGLKLDYTPYMLLALIGFLGLAPRQQPQWSGIPPINAQATISEGESTPGRAGAGDRPEGPWVRPDRPFA